MSRKSSIVFLCLGAMAPGWAADAPIRNDSQEPGFVRPKLIHSLNPRYPEEAKKAHLSGSVVIESVIDEQGVPTRIKVISSGGKEMDSAAIEAFKTWRFEPGTKDGKPVKVLSQIRVNFALNTTVPSVDEDQRTAFNIALTETQEHRVTQRTIDSLRNLTSHDFPPGKYLYGVLLEKGEGVPADPAAGFKLVQEAAEARYAPAMYRVAEAEIDGDKLPQDRAKGMELMEKAAKLGSMPAGEYLGDAYETGTGVPLDLTKSRRFFRDCAALGFGQCQYRLGKLMLEHPEKGGRDVVEAVAWLELAAGGKVDGAGDLLEKERERITPQQAAEAEKLKSTLLRQP